MSSMFSIRPRAQKTPKVCISSMLGPQTLAPANYRHHSGIWWHGFDAFWKPVHIHSLLNFPLFVPPSTWTDRTIHVPEGRFIVYFQWDGPRKDYRIVAELHGPTGIIGYLDSGNLHYNKQGPFDTGICPLSMYYGTGFSAARIMV